MSKPTGVSSSYSAVRKDGYRRIFSFENGVKLTLLWDNNGYRIEELNSTLLENVHASVSLFSDEPMSCNIWTYYKDGYYPTQKTDYTFTEDGLTISINGYGTFEHKFSVNFYNPLTVQGVEISDVNVHAATYYDENNKEGKEYSYLHGTYSFNTYHDSDDRLTETTDESGITTYCFEDPVSSVSFRVKYSEDGKTISFPDITEEILNKNAVSVRAYVK